MTIDLDHAIDPAARPGTGAVAGFVPEESARTNLLPALWTLWSLPIATFQVWTTGWASSTRAGDPMPTPEMVPLPLPGEPEQPGNPAIPA
jgi:hypothetical protein